MIIGLGGYAGAGKDTVREILEQRYGAHGLAFADPMRAMIGALLDSIGAPHRWMTDRDLKEQPIPDLGVSYRMLAQRLGTEWGRSFSPTFWVDLTGARVRDDGHHVISDVRFPNEANWIHAHGGEVWRIDRPDTVPVATHVSESHVMSLRADRVIDNSGDLAALLVNVEDAWTQAVHHRTLPVGV